MIKVRHFAAKSGTELAYEIEEWLEHPSHEFISISYDSVFGLIDLCERALLVYLEHKVPVV